MELDYKKIADAIYQAEKDNNWKEKGTITVDGIKFAYEYFALEGYEEPCYDIESPRCSPGGYYDLDAWIVTLTFADNDGRYDDIEIDDQAMSEAYTESLGGETYCVTSYFENQK